MRGLKLGSLVWVPGSLLVSNAVAYACSVAIDPDRPGYDPIAENGQYNEVYVFAVLVLLPAAIFLGFILTGKFWLGVILALSAIPLQIFLFVGLALGDSCGFFLHEFVRDELVFLSLIVAMEIIAVFWKRNKRTLFP